MSGTDCADLDAEFTRHGRAHHGKNSDA